MTETKWKRGLPFADIAAPVVQPATNVFVMSCFAHAWKEKKKGSTW